MRIKTNIKKWLFKYLNKKGYEVLPERLIYDWQKKFSILPTFNKSMLPEGATTYLNTENKRLEELESEFSKLNIFSSPLWTDQHLKEEDILYFRGDNAYVWQLRGTNMNVLGYALTTYYLKSHDKYNLLERLKEDKLFGNYTFNIDDKTVSRDLLDSINEIYFLEKHLEFFTKKRFNILDIGAGYGRLAYRMIETYDNLLDYYCTDGIPISSFIAEYYLKFRGVDHKAKVIPPNQLDILLSEKKIDLAINIHSFSECSIESVEWWISILSKYSVEKIMIVPNVYANSNELLISHDRKSILDILIKYGYRQLVKEPKFTDSIVQRYGINPTYYYLFGL